jgi:pimeloyl-ACP methyl ester carboxylesterase
MKLEELEVRHAQADVNGIRMHFVDKGEGPLVVLLHGFPELWWSWRYQIPALVEAGFRVVAPDLRGYGDTDARGPFDIDTLRDDVIALFDHLHADKPILVAHDWGGAVAWHLAATRPERCKALVVMNCPHPAVFLRALFSKWSQVRRSWYMFFFQLPLLPEWLLTAQNGAGVLRLLRSNVLDRTHFGRDELDPFVQAVRKPGRAKAMIDWYRAAIRAGLRAGPRGGPKYDPITVPTLLLWGMQDAALGYDDVVPGTEHYAPRLEIQKIEGCGHFVQQEQPDDVNRRLLEFVRRAS